MYYDELLHSGVKGMKWRKGRKTPLDPSNTNLQTKKVNPEARIGKEQNLSLNGTTGKRLQKSEVVKDNTAERNSMNQKMADAEAKEKQRRKELAIKAQQDTLAKAKQRSSTTKSKKETKVEQKKEPQVQKKTTTSSNYIQRRHVSRYKF